MLGGGGFCFPFLVGGAGAGGGEGDGAGWEDDRGRVMGGWWRGEGVAKKA